MEAEILRKNLELMKTNGLVSKLEGTIQDALNEGLKRVIDYSRQYPITSWTGGDLKRIYNEVGGKLTEFVNQYNTEQGIVTNLHLRTPIVSKHSFRSAKPQRVIDDMPLEEFKKEFGIEPLDYETV